MYQKNLLGNYTTATLRSEQIYIYNGKTVLGKTNQ